MMGCAAFTRRGEGRHHGQHTGRGNAYDGGDDSEDDGNLGGGGGDDDDDEHGGEGADEDDDDDEPRSGGARGLASSRPLGTRTRAPTARRAGLEARASSR